MIRAPALSILKPFRTTIGFCKFMQADFSSTPLKGSQELEHLIKLEEQRLKSTLSRVEAHFLRELEVRSQELRSRIGQLQQANNAPSQQLLNSLALPFSDRLRHLREKLNTAAEFKQLLMNSQMELAKACQLDSREQSEAKQNFNLICDYKKRRELSLEGKGLYTAAVCKHLIRRTFKKTAVDVYELLSGYKLCLPHPQGGPLRIACVGGGPGSDLAGALTYLIELGYSKFDCTILDFNADMWRTAAGPLAGIVRNEAKKFGRKVDLNVEWRQFDMGASGAEKLLLDGGFQLITCCWALNEMPFNQPMWQAIVQQSPAILVLVDGERFPIEYIANMCAKRQHYYSGLETPRGLIIFQ